MDILGTGAFALVSAVVAWAGSAVKFRADQRKIDGDREDARKKLEIEQGDRLEIHRDDLTFELLQAARSEVSGARLEMKELHDELRTLRSLEQHLYHFQQALDHLDAILHAPTQDERTAAERVAKAFLTRMRRLTEAKGTFRNEAQRADSAVHVAERIIGEAEKKND